jgi:uridine kinase
MSNNNKNQAVVHVGLICIFLSGVISYVMMARDVRYKRDALQNPPPDVADENILKLLPLVELNRHTAMDSTEKNGQSLNSQHYAHHHHNMPNKLKVDAESTGKVVELAPYQPIMNKVGCKAESGHVIVLGIAGGSGSGKTTLARAIYEAMGEESIAFISHDSYYRDISHLTPAEVDQHNFDHPDALETSLLVKHVKQLKQGESVQVPTYDFTTHSRLTASEEVEARPVVLVEGILILSDPELREQIDIKVFVDTDDDIRLIRRMQRDIVERGRTVDGVVKQYLRTVQPMHQMFVEPSKREADIIVPKGLNSVALDLVVSKLKLLVNRPNLNSEKKEYQQC